MVGFNAKILQKYVNAYIWMPGQSIATVQPNITVSSDHHSCSWTSLTSSNQENYSDVTNISLSMIHDDMRIHMCPKTSNAFRT